MEPIKITIQLRRPMVAPNHLFHADALLAGLKVEQAEQEAGCAVNPEDHQHDLPIERYHSPSGEWCFKASAFNLVMEEGSILQNRFATRRISEPDAADLIQEGLVQTRQSKPNRAGGNFKMGLSSYLCGWYKATAYLVADKQKIEQLLSGLTNIGARRGINSGEVESVKVESVPEKECLWQRRALPFDFDQEVDESIALCKAVACIRPPYWNKGAYRMVLEPAV